MYRLLTLLLLSILTEKSLSQVVINEVGIAPSAGNGSQFIELYNRGGCPIDLSCYTLVFSSTSGSGNPTGWTVKIPLGKTIAAGGYFLTGGTAGAAGVAGGTGYPTGGAVNPYPGVADLNMGTTAITANAVYMKQGLNAGSFPNTKGQLSLLNAAGGLAASVAYNSGNNISTYPLHAYTTCAASGNTQGIANVPDPGASVNNVVAAFSAAANQGIYLNAAGVYQTETSLSPGAPNTANGGTQICSGPILSSVTNATVCFSENNQTVVLPYTASNAPATYSITWNPVPINNLAPVTNAAIGSNIIMTIPASTTPNVYTGYLTLANACGSSCKVPFSVTVNPKPLVNAGSYAGTCISSTPVALTGTPAGGTFSGTAVTGNTFTPPALPGNYSVIYNYTDATTGCSNSATNIISVSAPTATYTTACTNTTPFIFFGQPLTVTGLHTVLLANNDGCTDTARIYLVVKQLVRIDTAGCDAVIYHGVAYTNSTTIVEAVPSVISGCDSIVRTIHIHVKKKSTSFTTACIPSGQSYLFNGQALSSTGMYTSTLLNAEGCDSIAQLYLTVTAVQNSNFQSCNYVIYNGNTYSASTTFYDTAKSIITGCDSLIKKIGITITPQLTTQLTACANDGDVYLFHGQQITASGNYTATLVSSTGCDSIVHLSIVFRKIILQAVAGCDSVVFNRQVFHNNTVVSDTLRSVVTGCDSMINKTVIRVNHSPVLSVSGDAHICAGGTATLIASSAASVAWTGFPPGNSITVTPFTTTAYVATALDSNGCKSTTGVTVYVEKFTLALDATPDPVLSGNPVFLQTSSTSPYTVSAWQPAPLFTNQRKKAQWISVDSSLQIAVVAVSLAGCLDTAYLRLDVIPFDDVYIPSGFTPNGDGRNETVKVFGTGISEIDFKIFNRWGQMIFFTIDKYKGWDGSVAGVPQPAGTYVYVVKVKKRNGQVVEKKGTVTLIR